MEPPLTEQEIEDLPAVVDLMTAARVFGIGRTKAYELARSGNFPCPVQKVGDTYRVLTAELRQAVGIKDREKPSPPQPPTG